eukprot:1350231-Prymnesium_polylepis.2
MSTSRAAAGNARPPPRTAAAAHSRRGKTPRGGRARRARRRPAASARRLRCAGRAATRPSAGRAAASVSRRRKGSCGHAAPTHASGTRRGSSTASGTGPSSAWPERTPRARAEKGKEGFFLASSCRTLVHAPQVTGPEDGARTGSYCMYAQPKRRSSEGGSGVSRRSVPAAHVEQGNGLSSHVWQIELTSLLRKLLLHSWSCSAAVRSTRPGRQRTPRYGRLRSQRCPAEALAGAGIFRRCKRATRGNFGRVTHAGLFASAAP